VKVPPQEPEQRAGKREAQDGDQRLADLGCEADHAQRDGGDDRDPRGEPVETVDPVDRVHHPDDPEHRERGREHGVEADCALAERVVDLLDAHAEPHGKDREADLDEELPAGAEVEVVVQRAEGRRAGATEQQGRDLAVGQEDRAGNEVLPLVDEEEHAGDGKERGRHGKPAGPRDRHDVDPARLRLVDDVVPEDEPAHERCQHDRDQRCGDQHGHHGRERLFDARDEGHSCPEWRLVGR
jgi:hypothetical protein